MGVGWPISTSCATERNLFLSFEIVAGTMRNAGQSGGKGEVDGIQILKDTACRVLVGVAAEISSSRGAQRKRGWATHFHHNATVFPYIKRSHRTGFKVGRPVVLRDQAN